MEIVAKTFAGLEDLLAEEIHQIGGRRIQKIKRGVTFHGDEKVLYTAALSLRTVLRLLIPVYKFKAHTEKDLYFKARKLHWEDVMTIDDTFAIDCISNSKVFNHSKFAGLRVKDAIADRFRNIEDGNRPNVDVRNPDVPINVHISDLNVTISLDISGYSLHQRGYRKPNHKAPLNEALAAGILYLSGWTGQNNLIDPMCGTGTILFEAAMIARNLAPRMNNSFAFEKWPNFDAVLWNKIKKELKGEEEPSFFKYKGYDISKRTIEGAREAAEFLGLSDSIEFECSDFFKTDNVLDEGVIVTNPPYGERLQEEDIIAFYKSIGDTLKTNYTGFEAWILSSNFNALKHIGLKPSKKIPLKNGALDVKLQKYEMYRGSKKSKFID